MEGVAIRVETAHLSAPMLERGRFEVKEDIRPTQGIAGQYLAKAAVFRLL
jgi:hypothetical protein